MDNAASPRQAFPRWLRFEPLTALLSLSVMLVATATSTAVSSPAWLEDEWPRFRTEEYVLTGALLAVDTSIIFVTPPSTSRFQGGVLFDDAARDALRGSTPGARSTAGVVSDVLYIGLAVYPLVIDAGLVAWGIHGDAELATQLALINIQSVLAAGLFSLGTERFVGRERPSGPDCARDPKYDPRCGTPNLNVSFLSGHVAVTVTSASLICLSHARFPLYGGGAPDVIACAGAIAVAAATAPLRVMADTHYASDVLAGLVIGLLAGYVLPSALHYGFGGGEDEKEPGEGALGIHVVPRWEGDVAGAVVVGRF